MLLNEVFGIATTVNTASYVDRGGLDERMRYLLGTERHIAIHGDSKQGKSWLRAALLSPDEMIVVQCQIDTAPESLFRQALGELGVRAEIRQTGTSHLEGTLDFSGSGELGNFLLGKVALEAKGGGTKSREVETETQPVGTTPGDLAWVARTLRASERRLVVEDFHYVTEDNRRSFSFLLKALGDYGVNVILVGVWPEDHLLTYYNGDLDGRVEDLRLSWADAELNEVLVRGADALNVEFSESLRAEMVRNAYGNVGLLQRLAEQLCMAAGVHATQESSRVIEAGDDLASARQAVSDAMSARYHAFADDFVRGMKRMTEGLEVYKHLLRAFTAAESAELLEGLDSGELLTRIAARESGDSIRQSDLTQALDRVDRLQAKIGVRPPVLTYDRDRRRLFLADRSFLFYREYGSPTWPWDRDDTLDAALQQAPEEPQIDLDSEFPLSPGAATSGGESPAPDT
jgi:hypothetical protein